jgi:DNA mismatch endonuclease (patch repair protein)
MVRQRRRDTRPELTLRRALHRRGLRYRVDLPVLPNSRRRVDIVFSSRKVAVFVDGCYWHRCPEHSTNPRSNVEWWAQKFEDNVRRDRETDVALQSAGWSVVRIWEHEDADEAALHIHKLLISR